MYEGLKMDVSCLKTQRSDDRDFTADFAGNWKQHSTVFENYLQSTGWRKNATQPIHEIYDNPNNDVSIGVEYLKKHSKTTCELSVVYNASYPAPQTTYVIESCQRAVAPFGRY